MKTWNRDVNYEVPDTDSDFSWRDVTNTDTDFDQDSEVSDDSDALYSELEGEEGTHRKSSTQPET